MKCLETENKRACVELIIDKLDKKEIDILTLYREVLTPAQNQLVCWQDETFCIWKEHVRTSIIRTIIECCYPYVVCEIEKYGGPREGKVLIGCPKEEYHEIGARMAADFFTLLGFDVIFVGANTPQKELMEALEHVKPKIIGISVTNIYNLVAAKDLVEDLKALRKEKSLDFKIVVGGNAFRMNPEFHKEIGVDAMLYNFEDIRKYCSEL
jgi:methanogenic corrinoid protein MtbC1